MKRIFAIIAALIMLTLATAEHGRAEQYPGMLLVVDGDMATDTITLVDTCGHRYTWEGLDDWCLYDIAAAIMDDNGTAGIADDTIIQLHYITMADPETAFVLFG